YKMRIKRVKLAENRELSDFLEMAWKSGSLSHALCASPVDVLIIKEMEDTNVQFWINCGKTQEQKAGIKQCLSVIPTLSSDDLRDDAHAQEAQKTIYEVKEAISTLINEESHSFDSFGAARLHYDLAERYIAKGLFIEALSHATKSYLWRDKHLSECFDIEWHRGKANIVGQADTKITKYDCPRFNMNPSSISPFAYSGPQTYPTPWSTVRCYLESSLQTGIVQEKIGNGDEAEIFFLRGQKIATVLHLPMFIARFSRALGKIYLKKGLWILALKNLKDAREHDCSSISCLKCTLVSEVALNVQLGDFYLNRSQSKVKESDDMKSARDFYIKAKTTLNKDVWNNTKCLPKPEIMDTDDMKKSRELPKSEMSKNPQFCCAFGISGACEYAEDCWHCGPSISEKSLFFPMSRHLLSGVHLLSSLSCTWPGKYCKLQGKNAKEYSYLLESTSENKSLLEVHAYKFAQFGSHVRLSDISWEVDKLSMESVMLGLKLAFILSREFRKLHEKVSRLLAVMYAYSEDYSTPERVSVSRCASYFHQSSTGSYFNSCFLSQDQNLNLVDDLREVLAPRSLTMLETSVSKFFDMLPEISILCISMLDGDSEKLLKHLLPQSSTSVWIMISKMSLNRRPILVIRPICEVFEVK
ncbi:separase isoform X1, partial [Tanacetum coccineum]